MLAVVLPTWSGGTDLVLRRRIHVVFTTWGTSADLLELGGVDVVGADRGHGADHVLPLSVRRQARLPGFTIGRGERAAISAEPRSRAEAWGRVPACRGRRGN